MNYKNRNKMNPINTNIVVRAEECGGNAEKMVRRFIKKVKKDGIIDECRERTHFKKPTAVRAEKKRARQRLINKVNRKRDELFNFSGPIKRRR